MRNLNNSRLMAAETAGAGSSPEANAPARIDPLKALALAIDQTMAGKQPDEAKAVQLRKIELAIDRYTERAKKLWAADKQSDPKVLKVRERAVSYLDGMRDRCRNLAAQCRVRQSATLH